MVEYDFKSVEQKWKSYWEKEKIYKFDLKNKGKVYSVDTPPPTVSGEMHIGHAFSYSQQDFIVRFNRMFLSGTGQVFYPFGTDDNGLPTERLVEKIKKVKSKDMSRSDFIDLCLKTLSEIKSSFIESWRNLGVSCDYGMYYSTIDENSRTISQKYFIDLYKKKIVYRKEFPTLWCHECQTSISQAELEDKEFDSNFLTIKFTCNKKDLLIATTRPELLGACISIFVNPLDKRYKNLVGKKAKVPIFNFEVPIIEDKFADKNKGTGALMICSYGDKYDVDAINKYKLTPRVIFNKNGTLNIKNYEGLRIKEARKKIIDELIKNNFVEETKKITHVVNVHDKCGTEIEFIPTDQWFIKILDNKKDWIIQGKRIKWNPEFMNKRYENWVNGLEWDWNVSRNRHFGVPIPVWYCKNCNETILASEKELPVDPLNLKKICPKCKKTTIPEEKVLDTWATSSLTPQISSSLTGGKIKIPFSIRPQGHDIIRTWAFYTIVRSFFHEKSIPWENIAVSGNVSLKGEKMSKSRGNVIDPKTVLDQYGADALRFWAASSKLGEDLDYQEKDLVAGKKFVNKLLNASNFVFMNLADFDGKKPKKFEKLDELFLKRIDLDVKKITKMFEKYDYHNVKLEIERLFWRDFCDNYLELVKKRIYSSTGDKKISAQYTLYKSLLIILKLISPIMPFITEEIYQTHFRKLEKDKSIHISKWPEYDKKVRRTDELDLLYADLSKVRQEKTKAQKPMNAEIILTLNRSLKRYEGLMEDLKNVTNAKEIKTGEFKVEFV